MKVLFAVNNDKIAESIIRKYQEEYKEIISSKTVYYFNAIIKELQKDKSYDRIVISEDLEMFSNDNYQAIDKFVFEKMDAISDEATNTDGSDVPIIFLCTDRRTKSDPILAKLFSLGIYGVLVGQDRSIQKVCNLLYKPRSKKEAKQYYKVESENVAYVSEENESGVSESEIQNIVYHYKKIGNNVDKCIKSFDSIYSQYSEEQVKLIINVLPVASRIILEENSETYRNLMGIKGKRNVVTANNKDKEYVEKTIVSGNKLTKPVIIPTQVNTKNVTKITDSEEERIAKEKARAEARRKEEERIAREKAKAEARRKEEERLAREKAKAEAEARRKEEERIAREKAKAEAEARRKEEERIAREKAKAEAEAKRKEEERLAREKAKAEAEARRKEEERLAREKAKAEAEARRKEEERIAREKAKAEAEARRKEEERIAREKAKAEAEAKKKEAERIAKKREKEMAEASKKKEKEIVEEITQPKRGRGRPRKNPITPIVETAAIVTATTAVAPKRGRGRPRKNPIESVIEPEVIEVKKRGRKKKQPEVISSISDETTEIDDDLFVDFSDIDDTNAVANKVIPEDDKIEETKFENNIDDEDLDIDLSDEDFDDEDFDLDDEDLDIDINDEDFDDIDINDEDFDDIDINDEDLDIDAEDEEDEEEDTDIEDDDIDLDIEDDELDFDLEDDDIDLDIEDDKLDDIDLSDEDLDIEDEDIDTNAEEDENLDIDIEDLDEDVKPDEEDDDEFDLPEFEDDDEDEDFEIDLEDETTDDNEDLIDNDSNEDSEDDSDEFDLLDFDEDVEDNGDDDNNVDLLDFDDEDETSNIDEEIKLQDETQATEDSDEEESDEDDDFSLLDFDDEDEEETDDSEDDQIITTETQHNGSFEGIVNKNYKFDDNLANSIKDLQETEESQTYNAEVDNLITSNQKVVAFVGTSKNGTSFVVNNLANILSEKGIKTAILDLTKNKNAFYTYTNNEERLRKTAYQCLEKLKNGVAEGINVDNNLTVYTCLPGEDEALEDATNVIQTLINNYTVVLLDCDFETREKYFKVAQEIYLIQSLDVLTIQPLTAFLRDLKVKGILNSSKLRAIINKNIKVSSITERMLIDGMSSYNDPGMTYMTDLFNSDSIMYATIPFDDIVYIKYLEGLVNCKISTKKYPKQFINYLNKVADMVYPELNGRKQKNYNDYSKKNKKFENAFSDDTNTTLDKMKKNY